MSKLVVTLRVAQVAGVLAVRYYHAQVEGEARPAIVGNGRTPEDAVRSYCDRARHRGAEQPDLVVYGMVETTPAEFVR
jgi:hypothetical protein